jgi:hypothetical protein
MAVQGLNNSRDLTKNQVKPVFCIYPKSRAFTAEDARHAVPVEYVLQVLIMSYFRCRRVRRHSVFPQARLVGRLLAGASMVPVDWYPTRLQADCLPEPSLRLLDILQTALSRRNAVGG